MGGRLFVGESVFVLVDDADDNDVNQLEFVAVP